MNTSDTQKYITILAQNDSSKDQAFNNLYFYCLSNSSFTDSRLAAIT